MNFTRRIAIPPTLPFDVHLKPASKWLPFPLDQQGHRIFSLSRHALWNACRTLGLGANDIVLVPAFHHGSEIEALLKAGMKIRYYELTEMLEPDLENLLSLLDPNVRALHLIHYWGFPQNAPRWRKWCDDHGLLLIEDGAQAFLANCTEGPVGSFGDIAFFCLYKTYGIPDGGLLISIVPPPAPSVASQTGIWRTIKKHFNWLAEKNGLIGFVHLTVSPLMKWWKNRNFNSNDEFELEDPFTPPSAMTKRLIYRMVDKKTAERRRENYRYLYNHLGKMVPKAFAFLPPGASPLVFTIEVDNPRGFLKKLKRYGVIGGLLWPTPHPSLPYNDFPATRGLRERAVSLPVHQGLTVSDLQQIVNAVYKSLSIEKQATARKENIQPEPANAYVAK